MTEVSKAARLTPELVSVLPSGSFQSDGDREPLIDDSPTVQTISSSGLRSQKSTSWKAEFVGCDPLLDL